MADLYEIDVTNDAFIDSVVLSKQGGSQYLNIGVTIGKSTFVRRSLLRFSLSSLPTGFHVTTAELWMYCTTAAASAAQVDAHAFEYMSGQIIVSPAGVQWVEANVTWNNWDDGNAWSTPGGDFNSSSFASGNLPTATGDTKLIEGSGLIDYINDFCIAYGRSPNFILKRFVEGWPAANAIFASRENVTYDGPRLKLWGVAPVNVKEGQILGANIL